MDGLAKKIRKKMLQIAMLGFEKATYIKTDTEEKQDYLGISWLGMRDIGYGETILIFRLSSYQTALPVLSFFSTYL